MSETLIRPAEPSDYQPITAVVNAWWGLYCGEDGKAIGAIPIVEDYDGRSEDRVLFSKLAKAAN